MSWTQAVCADCWNEKNPDRPAPVDLYDGPDETCAYCGNETTSGIYVRDDPATVPYPRVEA